MLHTAALAAVPTLATAAPPDRHAARVTVQGVQIFYLQISRRSKWLLVKVLTNEGLSGVGDASLSYDDALCMRLIHQYIDWMKGRSIFDVEWLRQRAFPGYTEHARAMACAFSSVEQALYDLQGQAAGVPTYALFGGKLHDKIRQYANINRATYDRTPAGYAKLAQSAVDAGHGAIKMGAFDPIPRKATGAARQKGVDDGIETVRLAREIVGPDRGVAVDAHNRFGVEEGIEVQRRLEPYDLLFLEEMNKAPEILAQLRPHAKMPTAGGENLFGIEASFDYLAHDPVEVFMPDVKYVGGMLELKKVSVMAEARGMQVSPHAPSSPIVNAAHNHVCATLPNALIVEFAHGECDFRAQVVDPPEQLLPGGYLAVPDTPGLGLKINERTARAHAAELP